MDPVRTAQSNFTYVGPTDDVGDLPTERADGAVYSVWDLSDEERRQIAEGGQIKLGVFQEPMPPVSMRVVSEHRVDGPDDRRCPNCGSIWLRQRVEITACGHCGTGLLGE